MAAYGHYEKGKDAAVPSPLEDRIREVCAKAVDSRNNDGELAHMIPELQRAMTEYVKQIRTMAVAVIPRTCSAPRLQSQRS
jgi:hypothetical protein